VPNKTIRNQANYDHAMSVIKAAGLKYTPRNNGMHLLFRGNGLPQVDYYPSTGKWRHGDTTRSGTPEQFVEFYHVITDKGINKLEAKNIGEPKRVYDSPKNLEQAFEILYDAVRTVQDAVETVAQMVMEMQESKH
jgi:hypothetical protein